MVKSIVVIVRGRPAEALRAAVGLSLRGDRVSVVRQCEWDAGDAFIAKAVATLETLGHTTRAPLAAALEADAVEVWT